MNLEIPNTGMVVSSDVGNSKDVPPKNKWVVEERLSKIALSNDYYNNIAYSGPLFDYVYVIGNKLQVRFQFNQGLSTFNNEPIKGLQITGTYKNFKTAHSIIIHDVLEVWSDEVPNPRFIKYGYHPYNEGNVINHANLPASTFSNLRG